MPVKRSIEVSDDGEAPSTHAKSRATKRDLGADQPTSKRPSRAESAANENPVELFTSFSKIRSFISGLKGREILRIRDQPQAPSVAQVISSLLNAVVYDDRSCEYEVKEPRHASTHIADIVIRNRNASRSFHKNGITFELVKDLYTREEAERMAPPLTRLLERWPLDVSDKLSQAVRWQLLMASHTVSSPHAKQRCNRVYARQKENKIIAYAINIGYFDAQTGEWKGHQANVALATITKFDVPDVPSYCDFEIASVGASAAVELPALSDIPVDDRARHVAARKICRLLGWRMHGRVVRPLDVPRLVKFYTELYGTENRGSGPYRGLPFCLITADRTLRQTSISPSKAVLANVSKPLPPVYFKSLLKRRLVVVLGNQFQLWFNTGDSLKAWSTLAWAADIVNDMIADGEPPRDPCNCYPEMASTETHPCGSCLRNTVCASLRYSYDNVRVCQACVKKEGGMA